LILPNLRASFGSDEIGILLRMLEQRTRRSRRLWEGRLAEEGLDVLLDHPETFAAVMSRGRVTATSPKLTFYVMVRYDDATFRYLVDIVTDLDGESSERRQFLLRAHLGNYSLWLSGLFPDYVVARVHRRGAPGLLYYEDLGATGYQLASRCELADHYNLVGIYSQVADGFRAVRRALNRISDHYLFPISPPPIDRLLRQAVDAADSGC